MIFEDLRLKLMNLKLDLKVDVNKAAVAILLHDEENIEALYVRRMFNPMDPWSGQVAFPGGRCKIYDKNVIETAIRETYEEIGFKIDIRNLIGVLGLFNPLNEPILKVYPVIFELKFKPKIRISREIRDYMWIPLKKLQLTDRTINNKIIEGYVYDEYFIWGLTGRITMKLLEYL
ncbi:MAG: CoA pyrophosphatase [Candidatus Methanomethylicia archaeon]|nr:CoA pyrophosphatase [Candidatus Methanomethylicia archaeon]